MKKFIVMAAIILISPIIHADDTWQETCKNGSELAEAVMHARQNGVAMSAMMDTLKGSNKAVSDLTSSMIIEAYDTPRYNTEEIKQSTINDFRDQWYLSCVKSMKK